MGYNVKLEREKKGWTQDQLSEKSGISRITINGIESGRITVTTTKTLMSIANALGVKVSDLFCN